MKKSGINIGLVLIIIGIIWILRSAGVIDFSIWYSFLKLWPLIFIAIGLSLIFSHKSFAKLIIWAVFLAILLLYGIFGGTIRNKINDSSNQERGIGSFSHSEKLLSNTDNARMKLEVGGATVNIDSNEIQLFDAEIYDEDIVFDIENDRSSDIRIYSQKERRSTSDLGDRYLWDIEMSDKIPWELILNAGAVKGDLDLTDLEINELDINIGASTLEISFSDISNVADVNIKAGVSNINLYIPENVGVKISMRSVLVAKNFGSAGFRKSGNNYYSKNYDDTDNKIFIEIEMAVGNVTVRFDK